MVRALDPLQSNVDRVQELLQQLGTKERHAAQVNYPCLEREFSAVKRMVEQRVQRPQDPGGSLFMPMVVPCYQRLLGSSREEAKIPLSWFKGLSSAPHEIAAILARGPLC